MGSYLPSDVLKVTFVNADLKMLMILQFYLKLIFPQIIRSAGHAHMK